MEITLRIPDDVAKRLSGKRQADRQATTDVSKSGCAAVHL
jgi:hypothetical protein